MATAGRSAQGRPDVVLGRAAWRGWPGAAPILTGSASLLMSAFVCLMAVIWQQAGHAQHAAGPGNPGRTAEET